MAGHPQQDPPPGTSLIKLAGGAVLFSLSSDSPAASAFLRTNARNAATRRREVRLAIESASPRPGDDWEDIPMTPDGPGRWTCSLPLVSPGFFEARAYLLPDNSSTPLWPAESGNVGIKVQPAWTAAGCSIYKAFVRMFRPEQPPHDPAAIAALDRDGWSAIPPSGTFRALAAHMDRILGTMGFHIVLLLPPFPVPTTHARMGRFGSPFASLDFKSVDPACAEFDGRTTPLEQFSELADAIHARNGRLFIDIPINHTGWASRLLQHHPDWFVRTPDGSFHSPGAWGVTWADLVELDYRHLPLWQEIADVFLFWCRHGVDGFRCDAGYMVPLPVWEYLTARVRDEFPDTVFLLEGLGGPLKVTLDLLTRGGLDWAYSELFQNHSRSAVDWYLPQALDASSSHGLHVHYAETHDNERLASRSESWARMRTALAALTSVQGAWGITCGVEWFASERVLVHGASPLHPERAPGQEAAIATLNHLLSSHPAFTANARLRLLPILGGEVIALLRSVPSNPDASLLVLVNLDPDHPHSASWPAAAFTPAPGAHCLFSGQSPSPSSSQDGLLLLTLPPGAVFCLPCSPRPIPSENNALDALRAHAALLASASNSPSRHSITINLQRDARRSIPTSPESILKVVHHLPFSVSAGSIPFPSLPDGNLHVATIPQGFHPGPALIATIRDGRSLSRTSIPLVPSQPLPGSFPEFSGPQIRQHPDLHVLLTNGTGAMSHVRAAWNSIRSQYDALLAANPDAAVPTDRRILFTRCRAWIVRRGFSTELSADCCTRVIRLSASHASWEFLVPTGQGQRVALTLTLHLVHGSNRCLLHFSRTDSQPLEVSLILRPDIEDRCFHDKTTLANGHFDSMAAATLPTPDGFAQPCRDGFLVLKASNAIFSPAPESLSTSHPLDAARGLGHSSDLFSPGFFSASLATNIPVTLDAALSATPSIPSDPPPLPALPAPTPWSLRDALLQFVVRRDSGHTIIAGYPWFLDWGRDTLIALRGLIAAGDTDTSRRILLTFARFEDRGTLPNMIRGSDCSNRDTSDAPLWFFTATADLVRSTGPAFLDESAGGRAIRAILGSIIAHYQSGTPNGIHTDPASALVFSPSHFTWMDTNHPAGTPREGYPIEIQALWHAALSFMASHGDDSCAQLALRVATSIESLFPHPSEGWLADCLHAPSGTPAALASRDDHLRPNQLFAVTLGAVTHPDRAAAIIHACSELLVPGAIRTLADRPVAFPLPVLRNGHLLNDPLNPFWPHYSGDEDTRRKPAYHNGTAWPWPMPSLAEAFLLSNLPDSIHAARSILDSADALLSSNCLGHLPEITDGASPHSPGGCGAQAWSVSELLRVRKLLLSSALGK